MIALFFESNNPCIIIKFENGNYKYSGFDLGELLTIKGKFYKKIGKLIDYLKNKSYIKCVKLINF
jgi:hypothetical protein